MMCFLLGNEANSEHLYTHTILTTASKMRFNLFKNKPIASPSSGCYFHFNRLIDYLIAKV